MEILTGWPSKVKSKLYSKVYYIANSKVEVEDFYVGRTVDLNQRKSTHGCDKIIPIYQTDSKDNAIEIEDYLIKSFYFHSKCSNDAQNGGGGISEDYIYYVYVAIWF
jgi:hypothetical protein